MSGTNYDDLDNSFGITANCCIPDDSHGFSPGDTVFFKQDECGRDFLVSDGGIPVGTFIKYVSSWEMKIILDNDTDVVCWGDLFGFTRFVNFDKLEDRYYNGQY